MEREKKRQTSDFFFLSSSLAFIMADMNTSIAEETPPLSKKQRGRLKKLRKRIQETKYGSDMSGLTSSSDLVEWNELLQQQAASDDAKRQTRRQVAKCRGVRSTRRFVENGSTFIRRTEKEKTRQG